MSYEKVVQGNTKEEVLDLAMRLIERSDPYRQPYPYAPTQRADGTWICTVCYRGVD